MASNPVTYENKDGIGVITVNNPPFNALSREVRDGLLAAIRQAEADDGAKAIVLTGEGQPFSAGADITEFDSPLKGTEINQICAALEEAHKPVVAALHGASLGEGLEIALACHYRIASKDARLGLPEVKLGLIPGGGGTQRLPRLTGAKAALDLIISGDPVSAEVAKKAAFVDEIAEGDVMGAALALAKDKAALGGHPKTGELSDKLDAERGSPIFAETRAELKKQKRHQHAPLRCVDAVEAAFQLPLKEGLIRERELFYEALQDWQSKALIHAFFAERHAAKIPGVSGKVKLREIQSAGIVGSGTMGGGIAIAFANAGIPVVVVDRDQGALYRGLGVVAKTYDSMVKRGRLDQATMEARLASIKTSLDYNDLAAADIVVEAAFEDMGVKEQVFRELDRVCKKGAILASNTSTLDIDQIAGFTQRAPDVLGMHFFSPANVMRLVEVVRGKETSAEVLATTLALAKRLGKVGVLVGNCDGFVGNRMLEKYLTEAMLIVEEGASPTDVDAALTSWGMAMGPFAVCDLAGIDVNWHIRQRRVKLGGSFGSALLDRFYEAGRLGQKTGKGFYRYEGRTALPDPDADAIVAARRAELGARVRPVSEQEIVKRTIYALVNEGANIIDEGIAARSDDIDVIYLYGYGFPAWRGGPMKYAELRGLAEVLSDIDIFHMRFGERWRPAPLLKSLVTERKPRWPR